MTDTTIMDTTMTDTLHRPVTLEEAAPAPHRKRWTRKEFGFWAQNGILTGRYELINGDFINKMGQNHPHAITLMLITEWLILLFGSGRVQCQLPIDVAAQDNEINAPEPDVSVLSQVMTTYLNRNPGPSDVVLVVEVSDTTLRFDLQSKAPLYARAGIEEYWVADVSGRRIIAHRNPTPTGYADVVVYDAEMQLAPTARPEALVRVSDLLAPERSLDTVG